MSDEVDITACFVRYSAARDLLLYARTGERALVWRVYKTHRQAGLPVPDGVLAIFDEWAAEPVSRRSAKAIRTAERNLDVVQIAHIRQHDLGQAANAAARATASDSGLTFGLVKTIKSRWYALSGARGGRVETNGAADLQAAWRAPVGTENDDVT